MQSDRGEGLEGARNQLREIAAELEAIAYRLLGVHASLPDSAVDRVLQLEAADLEPAAEIRAVIQCVLNDSLTPAVRDLRSVAGRTSEDERGDP
ncbi:MAG TPA: hypothetical protein VMW27_10480 [Thermoanaerobaculia bacterium]|nr:hypothetical protein [Thermoanaerobaculia bacterium]